MTGQRVVQEARGLRAEGLSYPAIATLYGVHNTTVRSWLVEGRLPNRRGADRYNWAGDDLGYTGAHAWLRRHHEHEKTECEHCGKTGKLDWAYTGTPGEWSRNRDDYLILCRSCHIQHDRAAA